MEHSPICCRPYALKQACSLAQLVFIAPAKNAPPLP